MAFIFLTLLIEPLHRRTPLCENQMENKYQKRALFQDNQQNRRTYSFQGNVETLRVNFEKNHISFFTFPGFSADKMCDSCLWREDAHVTQFVISTLSVFSRRRERIQFSCDAISGGIFSTY